MKFASLIRLVFPAILTCNLLTISIHAQEPDTLWTRSFGGNLRDEGFDVQETIDGGFIVVGFTGSFGSGSSDVWLIKTNELGEQLWAKTYGTNFGDAGLSVQQTGDKGFIITGFASLTGSYEGRDYYLIKTDSLGDTLWTGHFGGNRRDEAFSCISTSDGGYILTGFTNLIGPQYEHSDMLSVKTDLIGDTLWTLTYGEEFYDDGRSVHETYDNCYIIIGTTQTVLDTTMHAYLMKVSSVGDTIWTRKYGNQINTRGFYGMQTVDKGFILGGQIDDDAWLVKTDSTGNILWSKTYGGSTSRFINSVQQTNDNGYIFTMWINDGGSGNYSSIIKTDGLGNIIWLKNYYSFALKVFRSVKQANDGGYILTGTNDHSASPPQFDLWLVRIASDEVTANFGADTLEGELPLTVQFVDSSSTNVSSWSWDFDKDGYIDSYEQNPSWTYLEADSHSVKLIVSNGIQSDTLVRENYITAYNSSRPFIINAEDVPKDQGGWVRVKFLKSVYDTDSLQGKLRGAEFYTVEMDDSTGWTTVNTTGAYGSPIYSVLAHTTYDSSTTSKGLIAFRVIAFMNEGNFVSDTVWSYSVDNLAPGVPSGLEASLIAPQQVSLSWNSVLDEDFNYYRIYRSLIPDFMPSITDLLSVTVDSSYIDQQVLSDSTYYYRLSVIDFAGNESDFTPAVSARIVAIKDNDKISDNYLIEQNYPNPFNPSTTIRYAIPQNERVCIKIYNILGEEIRTLINKKQPPGWHFVKWDGKDNQGQLVSNGVYFYRISAGVYSDTIKMLYLK
jgi:PKD repeat protein